MYKQPEIPDKMQTRIHLLKISKSKNYLFRLKFNAENLL